MKTIKTTTQNTTAKMIKPMIINYKNDHMTFLNFDEAEVSRYVQNNIEVCQKNMQIGAVVLKT